MKKIENNKVTRHHLTMVFVFPPLSCHLCLYQVTAEEWFMYLTPYLLPVVSLIAMAISLCHQAVRTEYLRKS